MWAMAVAVADGVIATLVLSLLAYGSSRSCGERSREGIRLEA
jgi:hypothetical protein